MKGDTMQKKVIKRIEQLKEKTKEVYGVVPDIAEINFKKRGKSAGHCAFDRSSKTFTISFNNILLKENEEEFIKETVAHEFAHAVALSVYGTFAHDVNWRVVMSTFGIPNAKRCHSYDTTNSVARRVKRKFHYTCSCNDWYLTAIRHNKMVKGKAEYFCPKCKETLKFKGEI